MAFECIHMCGPELSEWREPGVEFLERFGIQTVEAALGIDCDFDKTGVAQHTQVL